MFKNMEKTILLIEDDPLIALTEKKTLEKAGYKVLFVDSAEKALKIAGEDGVSLDLILMDISLGRGMNGIEGAGEILKLRELPIVFLSNHLEEETVEKTKDLACYGYVVKNTGSAVLLASLERALKLFESQKTIKKQSQEIERVNSELKAINRDLLQSREDASKTLARMQSLVSILQQSTKGTKEFLDLTLQEALDLTESKLGYIDVYSEEKQEFIITTWSKEVMEECQLGNVRHFNLEEAGFWGEAVRQRKPLILNDFQAENPLKKGYPEGHAALFRYLSIPVFREDKIVAVVGVANKSTNYTEMDILQLNLLMDVVWKVLDRRLTEEKYKAAEREKANILSAITEMVFYYKNPDMEIEWCNKAAAEFLGLEMQDIKKKRCYEIWHKSDEPCYPCPVSKSFKTGEVASYEYTSEDGRTLALRSSPVFDDDRILVGVVLVTRDISDRVKRMKEIEEQNEFITTILDNLPIGLAVNEISSGKASYVNKKFSEIYGWPDDTFKDVESFFNAVYPDPERRERIRARITEDIKSGDPKRMTWPEIEITTSLGEKRYITAANIPLSEQDKMISTVLDITLQRQYQDSLKGMIHHREILMRELQHRVKNNLSVLNSLLSLEMSKIKDNETRQVFMDAQGRIQSMMTLYKHLYLSENLTDVDLDIYIKNLSDSIFTTYKIEKGRIKIYTNLDKIKIDSKRAISLGLILNELITNSLKYAFPDKRTGEVQVSLKRIDANLELAVQDDGIGLPVDFDLKKVESMGLLLVKTLTEQIEGVLKIDNLSGTRISVWINL